MFDLNNSNSNFLSIVNSVQGTFYPEGQVLIRNTSYYSKDYGNQLSREKTFSSFSLSRAMSGDYLYRSPKFSYAFLNSSLNSSLNNVITGGAEAAATTANTYTINNPEDPSGTSKLSGGAAMARHLANSIVGKNGGADLVFHAAKSIANDYSVTQSYPDIVPGSSTGHATTDGSYSGDSTNPGSGSRVIVLDSQISSEEKAWLMERSEKLKSYNTVYDYAVLSGGFMFDISNDINSVGTTSSHYPGVSNAGNTISKDIIDQAKQKAWVCPAMIELLIYLNSKIEIRGGFGTGRGANPNIQGSNLSHLKEGEYITDHALGRAFDIDIIGPLNSPNSKDRVVIASEGAKKDRYIKALSQLFEALSSAPLHLVPDLFGVSIDLNEEYGIGEGYEAESAKIKTLFPCIKYAGFSSDTAHRTHIHMSFSGSRSGIYAGPGGMLAGSGTTSTVPGENNGIIRPAGLTGSADSMERNSAANTKSKNNNPNRSPDRIDVPKKKDSSLADLNIGIDSKNNKTAVYGNPLAELNIEIDSANNKSPDFSNPADQAVVESGNEFLNFILRVRSNNPFKPIASPSSIIRAEANASFTGISLPADFDSTKFVQDFSADTSAKLELAEVFALLRGTVMSDEAAAIFTAIAAREGGLHPGSCLLDNGSGDWSFGLWGINLLPNANGSKKFRLPLPSLSEKEGWQLGYKNYLADGINKSNFRAAAFAKAAQLKKNQHYTLLDSALWIPVNQAYVLYTTATGQMFDGNKLGATAENSYVFFPWGDYGGGPPWGWISNLSFGKAAGVYQGAGRNVEDLKKWVLTMFANNGKKSKSAQYASNWVNGYTYTVRWKGGWTDAKVVPPGSQS